MTDVDQLAISSPGLDGDDLVSWRNTFATIFALPMTTPEEMEVARPHYGAQRLTGFRDDGRWVATFRSWAGDSAVPGASLTGHAASGSATGTPATGAPATGTPATGGTAAVSTDVVTTAVVSTELVSSVAVSPTHRRRGLLTRLMTDCLDRAAESGTVLVSLFASEAAIYGRYGFGVATQVQDLEVDTRAARSWHPGAPADPGRMRLSDDDELADLGPALFDAARLRMPGSVGRDGIGWLRLLERVPAGTQPDGPRLRAVHLDADDRVDGYVRIRTEMRWSDGAPRNVATVDDLVGSSPAVVAALWRFCLDLDLVSTLKAAHRGHGELLPLLSQDPRAVRATHTLDGHWWRVLDVPALLAARSWCAPGQVVLEVLDPGGPAQGRWLLDVADDGTAQVSTTTRTADLTLPVQTLPAVATGVLGLLPLLAAGRLDEHTPGSARRLHVMARVEPVALGTVQGF